MVATHVWQHMRERLRRQPALAEPPVVAAPPPKPDTLALVLGGGGGKGSAHLGVLAALEELELPIDLIVGTSIGGAIGVLYAAGLGIGEIATVFKRCALHRIAAPDPGQRGFIGNQRRAAVLSHYLGDRTFADLTIPAAVVAADLISGKEVVINSGPLVPALIASTSLPGIFPPVAMHEHLLVDGGVCNNVPVDVALRLGAQRTIAVELTGMDPTFDLQVAPPTNPLLRFALAPRQMAVASRAFAMLIASSTAARLAHYPPDVLLRPEVSLIPTLGMNSLHEGYACGLRAAREAGDQLLALRERNAERSMG